MSDEPRRLTLPLVWRAFRARWLGYVAALAAVALVSGFIGLVLRQVNLANISMLYLMAVLAVAVVYGRGPAIFASVVAFLTFDWFFTEPLHHLSVSDPGEWVSLLLFLMTAIVTGQLAAGQRQRAREAQQREREALVLYDVVRLVGEQNLEDALRAVAERLREELGLEGAAIEIVQAQGGGVVRVAAGKDEALRALQAGTLAAAQVLNAGRAHTSRKPAIPGRWVRLIPTAPRGSSSTAVLRDRVHLVPVRADDRRVGALLLAAASGSPQFDQAADRLLSAVAAQLGLAVERARLQREANQAEILRRTDELRRALLNAVSHDLRTPLASIMASAGSLQQDDVVWTEDQRGEFAAAIETEAQRLNRLVGNLLDLSRIEAGSIRPEKSWYDLSSLINDVAGRLRAVTAGHRLVINVPDGLPPVMFDYVEIDQVISNLIENAVKYTPAGTEVCVSARAAGDQVEVEVADRGPGIPEAIIPRLFAAFFRA